MCVCSADDIINWMPKIFEIWPGNNRFYCNWCITGPSRDLPGMIVLNLTSFTIIIVYSVFMVSDNSQITPALPIIFYTSFVLMQIFLFMAACSDPGIIPRKPFVQRLATLNQKFLQTKDLADKRICQTCYILRPNRASHCSRCQNCVQIFDHHCNVIGNCIGKRNYRYFILFLVFSFSSIAIFVINLISFVINKFSGSINQTVIIVIVSVVAGLIGIPLICFLLFHLYLALTKKTTREVIKNIEKQEDEAIENQWCDVDIPNINFFQQIHIKQAQLITEKIEALRNPRLPVADTLDPIPFR